MAQGLGLGREDHPTTSPGGKFGRTCWPMVGWNEFAAQAPRVAEVFARRHAATVDPYVGEGDANLWGVAVDVPDKRTAREVRRLSRWAGGHSVAKPAPKMMAKPTAKPSAEWSKMRASASPSPNATTNCLPNF